MSYAVEFTQGAEDDLVRLYDFLLDRAETGRDRRRASSRAWLSALATSRSTS